MDERLRWSAASGAMNPLLARLRQLSEEATAAPWRCCGDDRGGCECRQVWSIPADVEVACATTAAEREGEGATNEQAKQNAALIAESRNALPAMLRVVEAAHEWRDYCTRSGLAFPVHLATALAALDGEEI